MKNILILGDSGMLGYGMIAYFGKKDYKISSTNRNIFNPLVDNIEKLRPAVKEADLVVNCIGLIKPTIKNCTPEEVMKINTLFPKNLAKLCLMTDTNCYHITTDCVYSGKKEGGYCEVDLFDSEDLYGLSKLGGETEECMTIRTSIVGEERKGNSRSLLEWAISQKGKEVNGFVNHLWNGVTTTYLAEIIDLIEQDERYDWCIRHIHSPEIVNKYQMLNIFNDVYKLDLKINKTEAQTPCDRSIYSTENLSNHIATKLFKQQVQEMKELFKPFGHDR